MSKPVAKYFGSLKLDAIKQAIQEVPAKYEDNEKYGKQLKVTAARWEDGGISMEVWNGDKKESIKIGNLRLSLYDDSAATAAAEEVKADLPF